MTVFHCSRFFDFRPTLIGLLILILLVACSGGGGGGSGPAAIDTDSDGISNNADTDDDNDGVNDSSDAFPLDATESVDTDSDGIGNNADTDDDGDGVEDGVDVFPLDATETLDTDGDTIGNNADTDDDNDGFSDIDEEEAGTDPLNDSSCPGCFTWDIDSDGQAEALTDGLLVIRHLFGFSGDSLTSGAISGEAERTSADDIAAYLNAADTELDIDGDGEAKALTDGLLLIRSLFGFSGDSLISGAIGNGAERTTADAVSAFIEQLNVSEQLTFTIGTALLLESNAVFPGIVYDETQLVVSFAQRGDLFLRAYGDDFSALGETTQITSRGDITDHKHLFFQGVHYVTYSTVGDADLFLAKFDTNFSQVGSTVTVTEDSTKTSTNDMLLTTDGYYLVIGEFRPSDKNNNEVSGHRLKRYTTELLPYGDDIVANPFRHSNTASIGLIDGIMGIVAPSGSVANPQVPTQKDLLLIRFDSSWQAVDIDPITLVDSTTYTHDADGQGLWMSTGFAYDELENQLFVGYTFKSGLHADAGKIELGVYDAESFENTHTEVLVESTTANRAHFHLRDDVIYVTYDEVQDGSLNVYALTVEISR